MVGETAWSVPPKRVVKLVTVVWRRRRALAVMPDMDKSQKYTVRVVSEITESNGSSLYGFRVRRFLLGADGRWRATKAAVAGTPWVW